MFKQRNMFFINTKYIFRQIWQGNSNGNSIKRNSFGQTIQTRYLRIYPQKTTSRFRCLRLEVYGCRNQGSRFATTSTLPTLPKGVATATIPTPASLVTEATTVATSKTTRPVIPNRKGI